MRSRWRFPILVALVVLAFMVFDDLVLTPLHQRNGLNWTIWPNGLARILELPGLLIADKLGARFWHRTGWGTWFIMLGLSFPLYTIFAVVLRWLWLPRRGKSSADAAEGRNGTRAS